MDDNVLQTHPVHPALVQIELMVNGMYEIKFMMSVL